MRSKLMNLLTVVGAVTVLVLAANTVALATTGNAILAGKFNTSTKMTSIVRTTPGTGLQVKTKSTANSPFAVNGKGKVVNLNADTLDGLDSSALRTASYSWTKNVTSASTNVYIPLALPPGQYTIGYDAFMGGGATAGGDAGCYLAKGHPGQDAQYYGEIHGVTKVGVPPTASATTILTIAPGDSLSLSCFTPAPFTTDSTEPIHVYATRTKIVGATNVRIAGSDARVPH